MFAGRIARSFRALLTATFSLAALQPVTAQPPPQRPRLVVLISIDQFRADYVRRFEPFFLPSSSGGKVGGFRYLMTQGADFADAHHSHLPTATAPGHAAIGTGASPAVHGIIANDWFDRVAGKQRYCTDDALVKTVGGPSKPMSPRALLATTVGDELKMATNGKARVVGISFKDRAAILMTGHSADTVIWKDDTTGDWVTSTWYSPNGTLPEWVSKMNAEKEIDKTYGKAWEPLLPAASYSLARTAPHETELTSALFSHKIIGKEGKDATFYLNFARSKFGQEYLFEAVKRSIDAEHLGQDEVPDLLTINLATNDYVGHAWGPNSPEVMDITIRTDRLLSDFFNTLQAKVPGGLKNVVIALTGDHGVAPTVEEAKDTYRIPVGRLARLATVKAVNDEMVARHGEAGNYFSSFGEPNIFLNMKTIKDKGLDFAKTRDEIAEILRGVPGIHSVFTKEDVLAGRLPNVPWMQMLSLGVHPVLGGDLFFIEYPGWVFGDNTTGTSHSSPWNFDNQVPIMLAGPNVKPGTYTKRVRVFDVARTLSYLLGIAPPSGCLGEILPCTGVN